MMEDEICDIETPYCRCKKKEETKECDYQGHEFGAKHYPDSVCCKGWLYDGDSWDGQGFTTPAPDEVPIPCPKCNKIKVAEFLEAGGNE